MDKFNLCFISLLENMKIKRNVLVFINFFANKIRNNSYKCVFFGGCQTKLNEEGGGARGGKPNEKHKFKNILISNS